MKMGIRIDNPGYIFIDYKTKISQLVNKHVRLLQDLNIVDRDIELHYRRGELELDDRTIQKLTKYLIFIFLLFKNYWTLYFL